MTATALRSRTAKDLAQMARQNGVAGWHSMKKEELIEALVALARRRTSQHRQPDNLVSNGHSLNEVQVVRETPPHVRRNLEQLHLKLAALKNLAHSAETHREPREDRLVVMVRDPYWLHAFWDLSQRSVDRAQAAMGQRWHSAQPTLRVLRIMEAGTSKIERDITIHGGVSNWYVDVNEPPCTFRMEIGYLSADGTFYALARSNSVQTPPAGSSTAVDENWSDVAQNADMIYAMSGGYSPQGTSRELQELLEERLRRPLGSPMNTRFGNGAAVTLREEESMALAIDAEIIIYGATSRTAHVTLKGAPVQIRQDGTFSARLKLSELRQVIPIVASSCDGVEQRTVILAIERNTKVLEPVVRDVTVR
jgi:uncharacterized protein